MTSEKHVPAAIDETQIAPLHALAGTFNAKPTVLGNDSGDVAVDAGRAQFDDFAGSLHKDGRYHGVLRFIVHTTPSSDGRKDWTAITEALAGRPKSPDKPVDTTGDK